MQIDFDNTVALLKAETIIEQQEYEALRKRTKTFAPGFKYTYKYKLWLQTKGTTGWDGRVSILSKLQGTNKTAHFQTGMLPFVYAELSKVISGIRLNDIRHVPRKPYGIMKINLWDHQKDALNRGLNNTFQGIAWPSGIFKIATGGGKTELAVGLFQTIMVPSLFIVHRKNLLSQTVERFEGHGIHCGQIGDSKFDPNPGGMTVATIQTLHSVLKSGDEDRIKQFTNVEQLFFDEAHLCAASTDKGNQFIETSLRFRQAYYRWGLTATPFMRDKYSNQLLMGATGSLLCEVSNDTLIKKGKLVPPRVKIIEVPEVKGPKTWPECYDSGIVLNTWRNQRIIDELIAAPKPALVMVSRIGHAKVLQNTANNKGVFLPVVQGETDNKERTETIKKLKDGRLEAIICTTVFDEGMDLPELQTIILAGAGQSQIAQLQRAGRGLRMAKGKTELLLVDFKDVSGAILKRHSAARKKIWKDEKFNIEEVT